VQSSHGAIFAWSKDESFLLFKGATDAESQKAALYDLEKSHQACQSPPCGEPLPAAAIQEINDSFASQTERLRQLANHQVWVSDLGNSYLFRWTGQVELQDIVDSLVTLVPCIPDPNKPDCIPPINPPLSGLDTRDFERFKIKM
jgi:hypothetical protein